MSDPTLTESDNGERAVLLARLHALRQEVALLEDKLGVARAAGHAPPVDQAGEQRFRRLAEAAFEGIAFTRDGRFVDGNARLGELFGLPVSELVGRRVADFVAPESRAQVEASQQTGYEGLYEHRLRRADGTIITAEAQARMSSAADGSPLRITALRDVTWRKRLEERLRTSERMESVGRLAGGVAHDFNNLLTVIVAVVRLMERSPRTRSDTEDLAQITAAAERAADLTRQLLTFASRQLVEPKLVDFDALVRDLDRMLRRVLGEHVELRTRCAADGAAIRADPGQIEQVLMNLAVNARDAMASGGTLTVETEHVVRGEAEAAGDGVLRAGSYVVLRVSDTGIGIPPEALAHVFEPFFTTKDPALGSGLGLATCYGIARQCGGSISVKSEVGGGTTFEVVFPRAAGIPEVGAKKAHDEWATGHETVLLVEDAVHVRQLTSRVLRDLGYRVLEAGDGATALDVFDASEREGHPVQLVLSDVVMPRMNGRELVEHLRARRSGVRVLFTSGYAENTVVHEGVVDAGVSFLPKPYSPSALARRVRAILDADGDAPAGRHGTGP